MDLATFRARVANGTFVQPVLDSTEQGIEQLRDIFETNRKFDEKQGRVCVPCLIPLNSKAGEIWMNWMMETQYEVFRWAQVNGKKALIFYKTFDEIREKLLPSQDYVRVFFYPKGMTEEEFKLCTDYLLV